MNLFEPSPVPDPVLGPDGTLLYIELQRRPVLARKRVRPPKGKVRWRYQVVRTAEPTLVRRVLVTEWTKRSRIIAAYGLAPVTVSVATGQALGLPDWVLSDESHAQLRALRKERFPRLKKSLTEETEASEALEPEPELDETPPVAAAPPEPALVGPKPAAKVDGAPKPVGRVLVRVWSETKGVLTIDDALPESEVPQTKLSSTVAHQCVYEQLGRVMESTSLLERRSFVSEEGVLWTLLSVHERDTSELDSAGRGVWMRWEDLLERVPWYDIFEIGHATVEPEG